MRDLLSQTETTVSGKRLLLSWSGGRTSGYMTHQVLTRFAHLWNEIIVVFANTGQEAEETLEFIKNCDDQFNFRTVWVEAVVHHRERKGTTHRIVDFETAARDGEPFAEVIRKYGIPNTRHPHCTRELKQRAIESYAKSLGWGRDYVTAIGIRPDEMRRIDPKAVDRKIAYPLVDWFYADKIDVNDWWAEQPFNLELPEHRGNCTWCWKKSFKKHRLLLDETPEIYDFPARMEREHGYVGAQQEALEAFPRTFFRGNRSTEGLRAYCTAVPVDTNPSDPDGNGGCGESCELYPTMDLFDTA